MPVLRVGDRAVSRALFAAADRERFRSRFAMSLCNMQHVDVYWLQRENRLLFRSVTAEKKHPIPDGAVYVGNYTHPFGAVEFLGDLERVLRRIAVEEETRRRGNTGTPAFA